MIFLKIVLVFITWVKMMRIQMKKFHIKKQEEKLLIFLLAFYFIRSNRLISLSLIGTRKWYS